MLSYPCTQNADKFSIGLPLKKKSFEPIGEIRTCYDPEIDEELALYQRYTKGI